MKAIVRALLMLMVVGGTGVQIAGGQDEMGNTESDKKVRLIIRTDDIGFCHGINMAIENILENGLVTSISVLSVGPWLPEAATILKQHPEVSVGVHLCLNSEWKEYRWGPVLGRTAVPSLVDKFGHFHGSRAALMSNEPKPEEVERELRAQVQQALDAGLPVSYVDYHMGAAMGAKEFQEAVERIARDFNIGISRYFGEKDTPSVYSAPPERKVDRAVEILDSLTTPGIYLLVVHPGADTPEMQAMTDLNVTGLPFMSRHRQAEADMLCDPRFKAAIKRNNIELVGYKDLPLDSMKRAFEAPSYAEAVKAAKESMPPNPYDMYEAPK